MTNSFHLTMTAKQIYTSTQVQKTKHMHVLFRNTLATLQFKRFSVIAMSAMTSLNLAYAEQLELRSDTREPKFAQVMYAYYQNRPYEALTTILADRQLSSNAGSTGNALVSDLYARYGLLRDADIALRRTNSGEMPASTLNGPWLSYASSLYKTGQDSLALNFMLDPPALLTPSQESERMVMVTNLLARTGDPEGSIVSLQSFKTQVHYYRKLARYNMALILLQKKKIEEGQSYTPIELQVQKERETLAIRILEDLVRDRVPPLLPIIRPIASDINPVNLNQVSQSTQVVKSDKKPTNDQGIIKRLWGGLGFRKPEQQSLIERRQLTNSTTFTKSALTGADIKDSSITDREMSNLNDKIALSLSYLRLLRDEPRLAKTALRNVQLDSPYSNKALLTSAHIYYQLKDYTRSFNFSNALIKRNPADSIVQEGWLLSASALEEQKDADAVERYRAAIDVYKVESSRIAQFDKDLESIDVLKIFPVEVSDPILLGLPKVQETLEMSLWAQLLGRSEIFTLVQQLRQIDLLQGKLAGYEKELAEIKAGKTTDVQKSEIKAAQELLNKLKSDFQQSAKNDKVALVAHIRASLRQKQFYLDHYLTESIFGLQRVTSKQSSANN
jgi:hypothetical protein